MYKTKARVLSTKKMLSVHFIPPLQSSYKLLKSYSKGVIFLEWAYITQSQKMLHTDSRKTKRQRNQCWQKLCERQVEPGYVGKRAEVILGETSIGKVTVTQSLEYIPLMT